MTKSIMYNLCIQQSMNTKNDLKLITFSFLILTFQKKECISFLEISYKKMCDFMHTKIITVLKRELLFDCSILYSYLMGVNAIDQTICPEVLGMTKCSIA